MYGMICGLGVVDSGLGADHRSAFYAYSYLIMKIVKRNRDILLHHFLFRAKNRTWYSRKTEWLQSFDYTL